LLGVGQDVVSRCESGKRRVDVVELQRWAEACGTSLVDFSRQLTERMQRSRHPKPLRSEAGPAKR
jgi:hypothetical protein